MNKEALAGHETTMAFLRKAIAGGTYLQRPRNTSPKQWAKQRTIGFGYAFQDTTLKELGNQYGGTTGNSSALNRKFLDNIHRNSSPELQAQYPRETIPDRKPLGQESRERISKRRGGRSLRIKKAMEELDITVVRAEDIDDIAKAAGVTRNQLFSSRPVLENWEIPMDRFRTPHADFAEKLRNEKDDKKLQDILDSSSPFSLIWFLHRDFNHEILTTVLVIARKKGFQFHNKQAGSVAEIIRTAGIPVRPIVRFDKNGDPLGSYYIVYAKHEERIAEVLRNDPNLQRFR